MTHSLFPGVFLESALSFSLLLVFTQYSYSAMNISLFDIFSCILKPWSKSSFLFLTLCLLSLLSTTYFWVHKKVLAWPKISHPSPWSCLSPLGQVPFLWLPTSDLDVILLIVSWCHAKPHRYECPNAKWCFPRGLAQSLFHFYILCWRKPRHRAKGRPAHGHTTNNR